MRTRTNHLAWFGPWRTDTPMVWRREGTRGGLHLTVQVRQAHGGTGWTWTANGRQLGAPGYVVQFGAAGTCSGTKQQAQRRAVEAAATLVEQARVVP